MSFLFGKRVNTVTAAEKISQFQSTTCDFGTPLPYVFGTAKRGPNLINYQDFYAQTIKTRQKTGKRSHATQIDYKYYAYIELALCEGIIDGINRLWVGDKEYTSLAAFNASGDNQGAPLSLNTGSVTTPTAYMASNHPDIAVGYDQMAYLYGYVFLGLNNASIPSYSFEVQGLLRGSGDGTDANPAAVIAFLLTLLGYGNNIDSTSYTEYLLYCEEADLLISTPQDEFTSQKKCQEVIKELLTLTNTYMFWSVDRFKFVPRDTMPRGQWTPRSIGNGPHLTPEDMAQQSDGACVIYERKDSSEIYNRFGVTFTSRANQYESETVFYEDTNDIASNGIKSAPDVDGSWLHTVERAVTVAEMQARINRIENIKYTFRLSWAYAYLEPGDIVTLTDPEIGLNQQLVMIDSITENADETLTVTALRREDATAVTYSTGTDDYNIIDNNGAPGNVRTPIIFTPPSALASSSYLEVWIALQGQNTSWGGCQVYASTKDGDYELSGTHNRSSNYGKLLTALTDDGTSVDVEFSNVDTVELLAGSAQDAADGLTDIYIDGEFCAYTAATLIGTNQYRLTLVRGKYGSTAAAHAVNAVFAMMDGDLFSLQLPKNLADKMLYLKFPSFNTMGSVSQDVTDVSYYTYSLADEGYTDTYVAEQLVPYAKTSDLSGYATINDLNNYVAKTSADYLKSASVSGNTLTLTKGDDNTVTFTPSGGLSPSDITTGTTNGTISVDGTDVAVKGVGTPFVLSNNVATVIPKNADLNDYLTAGTYYSDGSATSSTLSNTPVTGSGFKLIVCATTSSSWLLQIVIQYQENIYVRGYNYSGSAWRDWVKLFTTAGGTLTGDLTINRYNPQVISKSTAVEIGTNPLSEQKVGELRITDKNGDLLGSFRTFVEPNGDVMSCVRTQKYASGNDFAQVCLKYALAGDKVFYPVEDNVTLLGDSTHRWNTLYCGVADLNGNLVIYKTTPSIFLRDSDLTRGTAPSTDKTTPIVFADKDAKYYGRLATSAMSSGDVLMSLRVYKNDSTTSYSQVNVRYPATGDLTFEPNADNTWLLGNTSKRWKTLYCGAGDFSGDVILKSSYPNIYIRNSSLTKGTNPSSSVENGHVIFQDTNGVQLQSVFGLIDSNGTSNIYLRSTKFTSSLSIQQVLLSNPTTGNAVFRSGADNNIDLGSTSYRWKQLYAATTTIATSDERLKDNISAIPDAVLDAWGEVGWVQFQFKDALAEKGENARIHTGAIAQRIKSVFESHNLDPFRYGLLCYDEWDAEEEHRDEDGNIMEEYRPAGNLYSLRYEEALCMESAYQRRRADRLEARIEAIERAIG